MIYSEQFTTGTLPPGTNAIYTVPTDGSTYVLRDLEFSSLNTAGMVVTLETSGGEQLVTWRSVAVADTFHWEGRCVLTPGETLSLAVATGGVSYRLSGYRLAP